jgi:hypothetical protein
MTVAMLLTTTSVYAASIILPPSDPSIAVYVSSAPNAFGSPSWPTYVTNAIDGIQNGGAATGDPTGPSYYFSGTVFTPGQAIVTDYNSWDGQINPMGAFAGEFGNRLHGGVDVNGNGSLVSLSELCYNVSSSDLANALGFSGCFNSSDVYSATRVGILYGADGAKGGGDDTLVTSGSASQQVNEFAYVGVGNAFCSGAPASCGGGSMESIQDIIDMDMFTNGSPLRVLFNYSIAGTSATGTGEGDIYKAAAVPEPASVGLLGLGLAGLGLRRRYKQRQ